MFAGRSRDRPVLATATASEGEQAPAIGAIRIGASAGGEELKTFQIFNEIRFVSLREIKIELFIVVVHDIEHACKSAIVIKSALLMRPQAC